MWCQHSTKHQGRRFWCKHQLIGKASVGNIYSYCASALQFSWTGWGRRRGACGSYSRRQRFWCAYQRIGKCACGTCFLFELPPITSSPGLSGWGERGVDISLTSGTAILVCMPAGRESERAGRLFLLRIHRSTSTDWVG